MDLDNGDVITMPQIDTLDLMVLAVILAGSLAYFTKGRYWGIPKDPYAALYAKTNGVKSAASRDILEVMGRSNKNCVIFYGSQTGTAEDYASRLSKEGVSRFGLKTMVVDLEDYDLENLDAFPPDHVAFFVMATYGEGEPTDNAAEFYEFINSDDSSYSQGSTPEEKPLSSLHYVAFGLGNNTYEYYNSVIRKVNTSLTKLGATRIGLVGEGDDGAGTMEEDFLAWKEPMWSALKEQFHLRERESVYVPSFEILEVAAKGINPNEIYLGEPNLSHLKGTPSGPFGPTNPFLASISQSRELFTSKTRNCLYMEMDLEGSNISYETGDHIAVWPVNADLAVDRFLRVFGLEDRRHTIVNIKARDATSKVPFPTPSTYDAIVRYYLEISGPVSRQFLEQLAPYAKPSTLSQTIKTLASDRVQFIKKVSSRNLDLATCLEQAMSITPEAATMEVPFSLLIEGLNRMQPRYYSISSSSLVQPSVPSITAIVEVKRVPGSEFILNGVATNYLLALKQQQHGEQSPDPHGLSYSLKGPRDRYDGVRVPVHVRRSGFRLPKPNSTPVIMVGPGTGVAPFHGFVQERAYRMSQGESLGTTLLFFGCRTRDEDFLFQEEWSNWESLTNHKFELITAFSRDQTNKVYVQDKLKERAQQINTLLLQGAHFYVCGDAMRMAREVNSTLISILATQRSISQSAAEDEIKRLRSDGFYQEDVWS